MITLKEKITNVLNSKKSLNFKEKMKDLLRKQDNSAGEKTRKSENKVARSDIELVHACLRRIELLLELRVSNELSVALQYTFKTWCKVLEFKPKNDKADIILSALLQKGRIWDSLNKALEYVERRKSDVEIKLFAEVFENQFIYFLRKSVDSMRDRYSAVREQAPLEQTKENVLRFIREECCLVPSISNIPSLLESLDRLKDLSLNEDKTFQQTQDLNNVLLGLDLMTKGADEDIKGLQLVKDGLLYRLKAMESNIEEAESVKPTLFKMNAEWFDAFNPDNDDSEVSKITDTDELKKFYQERLSEIRNELIEKGVVCYVR